MTTPNVDDLIAYRDRLAQEAAVAEQAVREAQEAQEPETRAISFRKPTVAEVAALDTIDDAHAPQFIRLMLACIDDDADREYVGGLDFDAIASIAEQFNTALDG